jgi:hypothetical protein
MTVRGEWPPRRQPYAYDNGAFRDWKAGKPFDEMAFLADLPHLGFADFVVAPDIPADGMRSLRFSLDWGDRIGPRAQLYLAVQDGMCHHAVEDALHRFAGLFVGGTLHWKIRTAAHWVALAHAHDKPCHIGRVGTFPRVRWAQRIGADSIDSCLPLWSEGNFKRFCEALDHPQGELFDDDHLQGI